MINANAKILNIGRKSLARVRRSFFAVAPLMLFVSAGFAPGARADTPTNVHATIFTTAINYYWELNAPLEDPLPVISTAADFDPAVSTYAVTAGHGQVAYTFENLTPNLTYYFRVKVATEPDTSYTATFTTSTYIESPAGVYFDEVSTRSIVASAYGPVFTGLYTGLSGTAIDRDSAGYSAWRKADTWATRTDMPTARHSFAAAALGGKIYAVGGEDGSGFLNTNEEYDPASDSWATKTPMPTARAQLAAAEAGGKIYAIGGSPGPLITNEEYDPEADAWTTKATMLSSRRSLAAAVVNGKIYAIGGTSNSTKNEEYNPATNAWAMKANMPTARYDLAAAAVAGKIYVMGGTPDNTATLTKNEEYNPATNSWITKAPMPTARKQLAAAVLGGKIYVLGGNPDALLALNEEYTPAADTWTVRAAMLQARSAPAAAEARGRIYAIGGYNSGYLARNDVYDPGLAVPYTGLIPNTQYTFTAKSRNSMGTEAPASGLVPVSTYTLAALPGAPGIVARSALTQEVSWDPNGNPSPSGTNYRLKYSTSPAFTAAVTTSAVIGSTFTAVAGLVPNTSYYYDVAAVNDLGVQTAFTGRPASAGTLAALPGAPDITGRSAATQTISWASGGNPLPGTDYLLKYSTSGNFTPSVTTAAVVASTFTTVAGLDAGTSYYYDVAAVARDGTQTAFTGTPAAGYTLPAAPGTPVPAVLGVSSVSWSWAAAGSALNYKLYVASSPATLMATVAAPPYIRTGISTNTYTGILVAAVNLAGESAKSDSVSTYTLAAVPVNLSTAAAPATSTITVQWGANGNPALTQYRVDYWQQGGATTTFLTVQASTAVGGLTESTSYYFAVSALNGAGFYSAPAAPLLMPTRAGAPAGLADEAMDAASIRWTWSTVPTARSYKVYLASEPATVIGAVTAPLFLQTGLSTNTQTGVMVAAVNLAGDGVKSAAVNSYPLAAIPGVPDITNSSDTFQTLLWASRGNPAPGTNYRLKYSTSVAFLTEITTVAVVASTYTRVESLVPNTLYHYDVAAVNNNGIETPFTGVTVSSYTMAAIPGPPAIYRVTDITQSVSWAPRGNPVPGTNYRVKYSTSSGFEAGVTTTVVVASTFTTLPNLVPNTSYYYDAAAVSNIGIQTGFSGVPAVGYTLAAVPGDPSFTGWTDTTQSLEWAAGGNPDPGTRYYIEYSTSADFTPSVSTAVVAASTFTTVTGLTPGTSYYHRVAALNNVGLRSAFAGAVIDGYTLPPPPGKPEAADLGASSITWTWAASTSAVTYNIHLISDPGVTVAVQAGPPYVQLGLSTNTFNGIVVTAVNPGGEGALSPYPLICTRAALPGAPAITAQSSVTQSIAWDAGGNPGPGTDYRLKYSTSANFTVSVTTAILVQSSSAYITGLALGTSYYYDVAAVNLDGVQTAFTGAPAAGFTLPAAPGDPSAASVEPTYIVWTWTAIKSAIRYNIYAASAPAAVIASVAAPPFTEPGLSSNTLNGILVAAVNPAGEGLRSPAVSTYTLAAVPGAPAILDRSAIGQTLGWNGNGNPNPGTNYLVRYSTSPAFTPSATVTEMTSSTTAAVGGLAPNTSYYFDVAAINVSGFQTDFTGAPAAGYTLAAIPDPPFIVGRSSSTQDIAWNNGGNPGQGTRYRLKYSTAPDFDAQVTTSVVVASTFTRIAGLAANTSYYYDVAGINDPGLQTPFSGSPGAGYTLAASPGAPFITGRTFTAQSVAWNNGGNPDPGTSYLLEYSTSASFTPAVTTMTVSASTVATVTGLVPGTSYYYDVAAFNSVGMLTAFTGVPAAGYTLSSAPVPVPAVLGVSSISWTWAEVAGALNYIVYAASEPATVIASPSAPVFIETGLSTNTSYGILVSAVNPAGEGAQSAAVSTYTFAAGPLALSTGPAAADTSSIEVQWSTNTNPAGTQYRVDYWPQGGSVSTLVTVQASTAVTGLTEATSYYFTVRAVNGAGFYSAAAGPLFMTTLPGAPAGLAGAALDAGSIRWTWNAVPTAAGYKVYLASETATVIASPAEPSFTEAGLSTNT
ncbi:MAG: fibronectin type III domain-containing protein, partial [Elusimicrobia bacterium]|nr:fibronectin type III domain-containing protein [Elusimicrobiota bacterium]